MVKIFAGALVVDFSNYYKKVTSGKLQLGKRRGTDNFNKNDLWAQPNDIVLSVKIYHKVKTLNI